MALSLFTVNFSAKDSSVTYAVVPASSQPTIIRTVPADGASDVDVLDSLVAIFSEPVDLSSLASGIHLQRIASHGYAVRLRRPMVCEARSIDSTAW